MTASGDGTQRILSSLLGWADDQDLALGDSVMVGAVRALRERGIEVDAVGARTARASIAALRDHLERGGPRRTVIFHGIGWSFITEADFDRLLRAARDVEHLIVVTNLFRGGHGNLGRIESAVNEMLREQAPRHPHVTLVDWHRLAGERVDELTYDGAHLLSPGIEVYADAIARAVEDGPADSLMLEE